jgi:hypothetical protein
MPSLVGSSPQRRRSDEEWELRVSQRELHRVHVVQLTIEGRESQAIDDASH